MKTLLIALVLTSAGQASFAQETQTALAQAAPARTAFAPAAPAAPASPQPIPTDELAVLNGRQGSVSTVMSNQDLTAVNRGNTVTANTVGSGPITLGPGAFNGFAGVGNFVINSGHNNNLQGALTINVIAPQ